RGLAGVDVRRDPDVTRSLQRKFAIRRVRILRARWRFLFHGCRRHRLFAVVNGHYASKAVILSEAQRSRRTSATAAGIHTSNLCDATSIERSLDCARDDTAV